MALACPGCGSEVRGDAVDIERDAARCPRCGEEFVPSLVLHADNPAIPHHRPEPPPGIEVLRLPDGGLVVTIPRAGLMGRNAPFVVFAVFWNTIAWALFTGVLISEVPRFFVPLVSIFPAAGIVVALIALWAVFGVTAIALSRPGLIVSRRLFGITRSRDARLDQVEGFDHREVYTQDDTPVLGIAVRIGKKERKFGTSLTEAAREWLVDELNLSLQKLRSGR